MKKIILLFSLCIFSLSAFAVNKHLHLKKVSVDKQFVNLPADIFQQSADDFLDMTPRKYRKMTGKRLGLKNSIKLKVAQKMFKRQLKGDSAPISKGGFIVLAIIGWGFLGLGLNDDWQGDNWWIALLLGVLCWIPGVIYTLTKTKNYY